MQQLQQLLAQTSQETNREEKGEGGRGGEEIRKTNKLCAIKYYRSMYKSILSIRTVFSTNNTKRIVVSLLFHCKG